MAERRMFSKTIIDSDLFLDMPISSQLLYFHLSMRADDDGFINKPKSILRAVGCSIDDLNVLINKGFLILFNSGVVVIRHWKIHNYIAKDRYNETIFKDEKSLLNTEETKEYSLASGDDNSHCIQDVYNLYTDCIQDVYSLDTQVRLGKDSIGYKEKNLIKKENRNQSTKKTKHRHGEYNNVLLTDDEFEKLKAAFPDSWESKIQNFSEGLELKGYHYKSHYLAILNWDKREKEQAQKNKGYIDYSDTSRYENIKGW